MTKFFSSSLNTLYLTVQSCSNEVKDFSNLIRDKKTLVLNNLNTSPAQIDEKPSTIKTTDTRKSTMLKTEKLTTATNIIGSNWYGCIYSKVHTKANFGFSN